MKSLVNIGQLLTTVSFDASVVFKASIIHTGQLFTTFNMRPMLTTVLISIINLPMLTIDLCRKMTELTTDRC